MEYDNDDGRMRACVVNNSTYTMVVFRRAFFIRHITLAIGHQETCRPSNMSILTPSSRLVSNWSLGTVDWLVWGGHEGGRDWEAGIVHMKSGIPRG